jgi:hypothetical protein
LKHILIILFAIGFYTVATAQDSDVDLERISQKKLKKSLLSTKLFLATNLEKLAPTCPNVNDSTHYHHIYTTFIDAPIDSVWKAYNTISPSKVWQGKFTSFGFAYARNNGELFYQDETFDHLEEGQIQFLSLRYMGGIFKLNIAHELVSIDEETKRLQFCYMEYGKSQGTQIITLQVENGRTKITHDTYYKSGSKFRDKRIYPFFHEKTVEELHAHVGNLIMDQG